MSETDEQEAVPVIGIRDSGVGGLTVAREIKKLLPGARLLYFADTAHVPYGDRTPGEVRHLALSISGFLIEQGAQAVVFACNTSSAYALQIAKRKFSLPLVGMIEPGARAAVAANCGSANPIGVLATQATVQSRMYARWIEGLQPGIKCLETGCPEFVPLVESEQAGSPAAYDACRKYLQPLLESGVRTVVLGCTHYPLLLPALQETARDLLGPGNAVQFVDPARAVAAEVQAKFPNAPRHHAQKDIFFVSGAQQGVRGWALKLLENHDPDIVAGPVFTPPRELVLS